MHNIIKGFIYCCFKHCICMNGLILSKGLAYPYSLTCVLRLNAVDLMYSVRQPRILSGLISRPRNDGKK